MSSNAASPEMLILGFISVLIFSILTIGGGYAWFVLARRVQARQPLLSYEPRSLVPWGFVDLLLTFLVLMILSIAGQLILQQAFPHVFNTLNPGNMLSLFFMGSLMQIVTALIMTGIIHLRFKCGSQETGWTCSQIFYDLRVGVLAFFAMIVPIYVVQLILVQFWPSEHPIVKVLQDNPSPAAFLMTLFVVVIGAPVSEEFAFRVLLQGWLTKLFQPEKIVSQNIGQAIFLGERSDAQPSQYLIATKEEQSQTSETAPPNFDTNPYAAPSATTHAETIVVASIAEDAHTPLSLGGQLAIGFTSLIFALMHWSHGPDWVPLFFLSLGLGYLYHQTGRIWPGMVVHFLLNMLGMFGLTMQVLMK